MPPYLSSPAQVRDATDLLASHGAQAAAEAATRADRSRDLGNHIHYCRWRQVERLLAVLASPHALGTVH